MDNQTLAALEQVLLAARIANVIGTEAQWTAADPVLLNGEIGLVKGTKPVKFKVGDGVKKWSELGWGQPMALSQLTADATHRLVTDTQIAGWNDKAEKTPATTAADGLMSAADKTKLNGVAAGANNYVHPAAHPATMITEDASHRFATDAEKAKWNQKGEVFFFDYAAYTSGDTTKVNTQKAIVKAIHAAAKAGSNVAIFVRNVSIPDVTNGRSVVSGSITVTEITATTLKGTVNNFAWNSNDNGETLYLVTAQVTFKTDGTVVTEKIYLSKELVTYDGLPAYEIVKATTESGFASTYHLMMDGRKVGASINIPLDQVLRGSSIKTVATANSPYTGAKVGDKYIEFLFQNNNTPQYLPVQDLVDVYKGDNTYIQVSASNVITLNYAGLKTKLQTDFGSVFDPKGAGTAAAQKAIDEFKASSFIIQCTIPGMN